MKLPIVAAGLAGAEVKLPRLMLTLAWYVFLGGALFVALTSSFVVRDSFPQKAALMFLAMWGWRSLVRYPPRWIDADRRGTQADAIGSSLLAVWFMLGFLLQMLGELDVTARVVVGTMLAIVLVAVPVACALHRAQSKTFGWRQFS